jgi:hypothetical protein
MRDDIQLFWNVLIKAYHRAPHMHYKIYQDHFKWYKPEEVIEDERPMETQDETHVVPNVHVVCSKGE